MENTKAIKIGVWLELGVGAPFRHEGLSRLIFYISEGLLPEQARFILTIPEWMEKEVRASLQDLAADQRQLFEVWIPKKKAGPVIRWLANRQDRDREEPGLSLGAILARIKRAVRAYAMFSLSKGSWLSLIFSIVLGAILAAPISLLGVLAFPAKKLASLISRKLNGAIEFMRNGYTEVYFSVLAAEFERMARAANANRHGVDCWFLINPFSTSSAHLLKKPVVSLLADFVPAACPAGFSSDLVSRAKYNLARLDSRVKYYITISRHVTERQATQYLGIDPSRIRCVYHGSVSIAQNLPFAVARPKAPEHRALAAQVIRSHLDQRKQGKQEPNLNGVWSEYLMDFPFEDVRYVFVSTQNRPYKNTLRVVQAVENLIRKHYFPVKLIMTGAMDAEIDHYVKSRHLYYDVISIPRVPDDVLAALYYCSAVAIHASFFEGGIGAFPFYEAVSVGTPVVLTRNPATLEFDTDPVYLESLVDPYSVSEIEGAIKQVCQAPEETLARQRQLYSRISGRTWQHAAKEYLQVFSDAIS